MGVLTVIQAMQKYKEVPWWWFSALLVLSFIAGRHFKYVPGDDKTLLAKGDDYVFASQG